MSRKFPNDFQFIVHIEIPIYKVNPFFIPGTKKTFASKLISFAGSSHGLRLAPSPSTVRIREIVTNSFRRTFKAFEKSSAEICAHAP